MFWSRTEEPSGGVRPIRLGKWGVMLYRWGGYARFGRSVATSLIQPDGSGRHGVCCDRRAGGWRRTDGVFQVPRWQISNSPKKVVDELFLKKVCAGRIVNFFELGRIRQILTGIANPVHSLHTTNRRRRFRKKRFVVRTGLRRILMSIFFYKSYVLIMVQVIIYWEI